MHRLSFPCFAILASTVLSLAHPGQAAAPPPTHRPHVLLITVDTLRPDHLSGYGYERATSPHLDQLMAGGARFTAARTVVPLTCPALASMITTLEPQDHGATRNGLRIRPRLPSFPKLLSRLGYATAALVSNWTLKDELCGLAEHFDDWHEVLTRRRLFFGGREADANDVTDDAVAWIDRHLDADHQRPFFLWAHYVEPHFPYQLHREFLDQLGPDLGTSAFSARNRYDTEIAFVDASIGRLLEAVQERIEPASMLVIFTSDHGESLGHHGYWGHGKHVYEAGLRIPLSLTWPGRIEPAEIRAPALLSDLAATLFGLTGWPWPGDLLGGYDFAPVIRGEAPDPLGRVTFHQAHRGTVRQTEDLVKVRRQGLLEVGRVERGRKEVIVVGGGERRVFDLTADREELTSLADPSTAPSEALVAWLKAVKAGLRRSDGLPAPVLGDEDLEKLKALGYVD